MTQIYICILSSSFKKEPYNMFLTKCFYTEEKCLNFVKKYIISILAEYCDEKDIISFIDELKNIGRVYCFDNGEYEDIEILFIKTIIDDDSMNLN
jgi:hypothetical protein